MENELTIESVFAAGRSHELKVAYPTARGLDNFWSEHQNLEQHDRRDAAALLILVKSFGQLDDNIMRCWRKKCQTGISGGPCQILDHRRLLTTLQSFPDETLITWQTLLVPIPRAHDRQLQTSQQNDGGDVLLTSLWLQNRIWHLALTHNLLSASNINFCLRFDYAFEIADRTIDVLKAMRMSGFEGHGQGLVSRRN